MEILSLIGQYWSGKVNIGQTIRLAHAIKVSIGQSHKTSPLKTEVGGAKDCQHWSKKYWSTLVKVKVLAIKLRIVDNFSKKLRYVDSKRNNFFKKAANR